MCCCFFFVRKSDEISIEGWTILSLSLKIGQNRYKSPIDWIKLQTTALCNEHLNKVIANLVVNSHWSLSLWLVRNDDDEKEHPNSKVRIVLWFPNIIFQFQKYVNGTYTGTYIDKHYSIYLVECYLPIRSRFSCNCFV